MGDYMKKKNKKEENEIKEKTPKKKTKSKTTTSKKKESIKEEVKPKQKKKHRKRKKNEKKAFSMVELLAVIVIIGVLGTIGITSISRIIDKSRTHYYDTEVSMIIAAAKAYTNDNRSRLPKDIGAMTKITLQELENKKYLKEKITDQNGALCNSEESYVSVFKHSKTNYSYVGYLKCPACETNGYCLTKDQVIPEVLIDLPKIDGNNILKANASFTINSSINNNNPSTRIVSYSYKIYVDNALKYNSGLLRYNKNTIKQNIPLYNYVPGKIKVVVTATNDTGASITKAKTQNYLDAVSPLCGSITYDGANKLNPTLNYCGGENKWINISTTPNNRHVWVQCDDQKGLGCAQLEFSKTFINEENEIDFVSIKDVNGKSHNCEVLTCIDKTTPKIIVDVYKADKDGKKLDKNLIYSYTVKPQKEKFSNVEKKEIAAWLNKLNYANGVYIELTITDSPQDATKETKMTSTLDTLSWKENDDELNIDKVSKLTSAQRTKNIITPTKTAIKGKTSFVTGYYLNKDGVKVETIKVTDKAGNSTTLELTIKMDRVAPQKPTISSYIVNSATATTTTTKYKSDTWINKYVYLVTNHPKDVPDVSGWKTNQYISTGAHNVKTPVTSNTFNLSKEGTSNVLFRSCDIAGNCSDYTKEVIVKLDRTIPTCKVNNSGGTTGNNGWYKGGTVTATGICTDQDNLSQCKQKSVEVQKVNSNSQTNKGTTKTKDIYDNAGNKNTCTSTIKYDKSAPSCKSSGGSTSWKSSLKITGTCTDNGPSGCVKDKITKTINVNTNGKVSPGTVTDNAGNSTTCGTETVKVDTCSNYDKNWSCGSYGKWSSCKNNKKSRSRTCYKYSTFKGHTTYACKSKTETDTKKCTNYGKNNCKIRGSRLKSTGYSWTCTAGHSHTTGYTHYCSDSNGKLQTKDSKPSLVTYRWVCPTAPYGKAQGWIIVNY